MGSTGGPDRKRRHLTSVSPTSGPMAGPTPTKKKLSSAPFSEDKKLDLSVLKYKNQKLMEQLEARKMEYRALEGKYIELREKQKAHNKNLLLVKESHQQLVGNMASHVLGRGRSFYPELDGASSTSEDTYTSMEEDFLSRIVQSGTAESSGCGSSNQTNKLLPSVGPVMKEVSTSLRRGWSESRKLTTSLLDLVTDKFSTSTISGLEELDNALQQMDDVHLRHTEVWNKIQSQRDRSLQNKADLRRLREEFTCTIAELEETHTRLAALKKEDVSQSAPLLFPVVGNKRVNGDRPRDEQKELQNLEATYREQMNLVSERLGNIRRLHDERIQTLKKLAYLKNTMMDLNVIMATSTYQLLNEQLTRSQSEAEHFRGVAEKLQIERDKIFWQEKELSLKANVVEICQRKISYYESRFSELEQGLQKLAEERAIMEGKLEEALKEPGRKQIIVEFKALVSSLPNEMAMMQSELNKNKEAASDLYPLRAEVQSLSSMLKRKENELEALSTRVSDADSEIKRLKAKARDTRQTTHEMKLFLDAFKQESIDPRDVIELKEKEYKACAHAETLKMSLDERFFEMRVKEANEAEALSQQKLAAAEAEITELRQNLVASRREMDALSVTQKSKHEEGNVYLSEIESIGQAYEDIQTQNQQLLQQITERDDHNIKLVMEGIQAKQMQEALRLEVQTLQKKMQHANSLLDLYKGKALLLEDQLKTHSEQLNKHEQDRWQLSTSLGNAQRKLVDVQGESQKLWQSAEDLLSNLEKSRTQEAELLIELDKERFCKKRLEDDLEVETRKLSFHRERAEGWGVGKLKEELRELRGILKCSVCRDNQKEVVIAKCYHLFCNRCVQKSLENRQRKCPSCGGTFGPSDVKPIYI